MTRITPVPALFSHYQEKAGARGDFRKDAGDEGDEGIMDQDAFRMLETTRGVERHGESKTPLRRPMTRAQEFTVLAIAFAVGAGLQAVYLLHGVVALD